MKPDFRRRARAALGDPFLQAALDQNAARSQAAFRAAFASLPDPRRARERARAIREHTLLHLDLYLERFVARLRGNGFHVHLAPDAAAACQLAVGIVRSRGARRVAKSKSMLTEEIELNRALQAAGVEVTETDLGEFIVQLRGERPSHITAPAVHLRRQQVAETFARELGTQVEADLPALVGAARRSLRQTFLEAPVGISGVNFGVAETGSLCLVTNEGNGRMVVTLPGVHIAFMGVERLVPGLDDLASMLSLLTRSATGQILTSYVTLVQGPRRDGELEGARERHVILVDNGRRAMAASPLAEALLCIRCGACLNACPVYREVGGHAYDSVYAGPIGAVVSPALFGLAEHGHLAKASTLCGACVEACPVQIDLPRLLLRTRRAYAERAPQPVGLRWGLGLYAWVMESPRRYRWALRTASWMGRISPRRDGWNRWLPPPLSAWTRARDLPPFARRPFRERWRSLVSQPAAGAGPAHAPGDPRVSGMARPRTGHRVSVSASRLRERDNLDPRPVLEIFAEAVRQAGGEFVACGPEQAPATVLDRLRSHGIRRVAADQTDDHLTSIVGALKKEGIEILPAAGLRDQDQVTREGAFDAAGLTGAAAGLADTGTLVLSGGGGRSQLVSLLPQTHLAVIRGQDLHPTMEAWLKSGGSQAIASASLVTLVTGPSRTADIEMTLALGVHGPGRLIVVCTA